MFEYKTIVNWPVDERPNCCLRIKVKKKKIAIRISHLF